MAKRSEPWNPNTADWLVMQRGKRTQDEVVADLEARGQKLTRAWLSRIENGAPFGSDLLEAFKDYYGSVPPPYEPPPETNDDLAAAIRDQTEAINALVELIRPLVDGAERDLGHRLAETEAAVRGLVSQAMQDEGARHALRDPMGSDQ